MNTYDVAIVGSGIVGATAALALAKKTKLKIAILEANPISFDWNAAHHDHRVSAISLASKNIFKNLQVWESIKQKRISPYTHMQVWDASDKTVIDFDCKDVNEPVLGYIIEDSVMRTSVLSALRECSNVEFVSPYQLASISQDTAVILRSTVCDEGTSQGLHGDSSSQTALIRMTKLLIGADGANSLVRDLSDIQLKTWDYDHTAIVTSVQTELPHKQTARQQFLSTGPLAFLPLKESHQSSIVWSTSHAHAKELLALNDEAFCEALAAAFDNKLGKIHHAQKRYHFPLRMRHAKNYVQPRIALIGDAAHTIHPLAGQGVNMGLLDAVCLVDVLAEAIKKNRDFSSFATLRRYERWRKSDNLALLAGVEAIKYLFSTKAAPIKSLRNMGLHLTNRSALIKNFFANYALGKRKDLPEIVL